MTQIQIAFFLALVGAAFGSFASATAWRIHSKRNMVKERSECESCHHKLNPLDLIPIFSWLWLKGRCRYCKAKINPTTLYAEIALAIIFALSYIYWPLGFDAWQAVLLFAFWLAQLVVLAILLIYDARWMLLPDKLVFPLIAVGFIDAVLRISLEPGANLFTYLIYVAGGVAVLAGVYELLYLVSKGRWVGFGDIKLCIFIGAVLGWEKSLLVLGLANLIGFFVILPGLVIGKLDPRSRIPFGPFLIAAFIIAALFGDSLINWYISLIGL